MTRTYFISLLFWICCIPFDLFSQGITITGRIVDVETLEPLPFAHVFIDQTTVGTVTDINGEYTLEHVENGLYKLVFSFVGYEMYYSSVTVNGSDLRVSARLIPIKEMLESVEVKGTKDKEWEDQLKQFNKVFFGDKEFAKDCKILNPWVLDFSYDRNNKVFRATASEPLQIENNALGYFIECTLQSFSFDKKGYRIMGLYRFEEVNTLDNKTANKWTRNRKLAYQGSLRYLFKSIIEHRESQNGFALYVDKRKTLQATNAYFTNELDKNVFRFNSNEFIRPSGRPGFYKITLDDQRLEVHHTTQFGHTKSYRDVAYPVSWIELEKGYIEVSDEGHIVNNNHVTTLGEYNGNRVAAMLPTNYSPGNIVVVNYLTKRAKAKRLQERVHLHTDKSLYYPGERLWLKAYLNYANQAVRDSLSRVLYVEIINLKKEIIKSKMLKVDSAFTWSEFEIPYDLFPGVYFIRSYTSWMKNYGPSIINYQPIIIMDKYHLLQAQCREDKSQDFLIQLNRKYPPLDSLNLTIAIDSAIVLESANCSISIAQEGLSRFPGVTGIKENLFFPDEIPDGTLGDFKYPMEYYFSISGNVFRPKKHAITADMIAIQGKMDSIYHFKTDKRGDFTIENLDFFGDVSFLFQARNTKGRVLGTTKLFQRESAPISFTYPTIRLNDIDTILLQSPINFRPINDNAVETRVDTTLAKVINSYDQPNSTSSFADYVISEADMEGISPENIVDFIVSRVPGLQVDPTTGKLNFRSNSNSNSEPLFIIDGLPINSFEEVSDVNKKLEVQTTQTNNQNQQVVTESNTNAPNQSTNNYSNNTDLALTSSVKSMIGHLTTDKVSKVEVFTRGGARYGTRSSNGTIMIYTKRVQGKSRSGKTFDSLIVEGFAKPEVFTLPSLSSEGHTSTIFWHPNIKISPALPAKISILAPKAPGKYLLTIEGLSVTGIPLQASFSFVVEKHLAKNSVGVNVKN
jgi:hypothetical protein